MRAAGCRLGGDWEQRWAKPSDWVAGWVWLGLQPRERGQARERCGRDRKGARVSGESGQQGSHPHQELGQG